MRETDSVTSDLSAFGHRELVMARDLLGAYLERNHAHFLGPRVRIYMNRHSGYVFLSDEDLNSAMVTDEGNLEDWLSSPYEGKEGFFDDLKVEYPEMHEEDKEWFQEIAKSLGRDLL